MVTNSSLQEKNGISSAVLKHTAYVSMFIDHFFCVVFFAYMKWKIHQGFVVDGLYEVYQWGRAIGRIAFILFAFMIAEGFVHTHNKEKYLIRLGAFALISEVPFDLAIHGSFFTMEGQNVYFTLFFGAMALYCIDKLQGRFLLQTGAVMLCCVAAILLDTDYMIMGVLLIVVFYLTRKSFVLQFVAGSLTIYFGIIAVYAIDFWENFYSVSQLFQSGFTELYGLFAFVLIYFYDGKKGWQFPKSVYYLFYPVHLLLLYGLQCIVNSMP